MIRLERCPAGDRVREYVQLPLELAREVSRHGLEEGIRRFVAGLEEGSPCLSNSIARFATTLLVTWVC
ncbi:MAG TPA: hypothetical protein VM737_01345 [Gemmatimonadota bacterium]|nr:hypothetical protein [Gemmatimonadota bacterium]